MNSITIDAVETCKKVKVFYLKFIAPNDTKATNNHQYGYHIHKDAWSYFLNKPGLKGYNIDVPITIKWQSDFETNSRFKYYGKETRNEYRITQFQRGFPFREPSNIGDLLIFCKTGTDYFSAYVLNTDDDIEYFLSSFGLSPVETNCIVNAKLSSDSNAEHNLLFKNFIKSIKTQFPESRRMAAAAEEIAAHLGKVDEKLIQEKPDIGLLCWLDIEYQLFKAFEKDRYSEKISNQFSSVDDLIDFANSILNRRKSRAGKSLEHHLATIFNYRGIKYETQVKTEGQKKPDFIFPDGKSYHNASFIIEKLFFLGAKTTCKDRWRQILNEADRIKIKHLMTLQQGISTNQLSEMKKHNVVLVVPESYKDTFPKEFRDDILSLNQFVISVKNSQG